MRGQRRGRKQRGKGSATQNHPFLPGLGSLARVLEFPQAEVQALSSPSGVGGDPSASEIFVCVCGGSNIWDLYRV